MTRSHGPIGIRAKKQATVVSDLSECWRCNLCKKDSGVHFNLSYCPFQPFRTKTCRSLTHLLYRDASGTKMLQKVICQPSGKDKGALIGSGSEGQTK